MLHFVYELNEPEPTQANIREAQALLIKHRETSVRAAKIAEAQAVMQAHDLEPHDFIKAVDYAKIRVQRAEERLRFAQAVDREGFEFRRYGRSWVARRNNPYVRILSQFDDDSRNRDVSIEPVNTQIASDPRETLIYLALRNRVATALSKRRRST